MKSKSVLVIEDVRSLMSKLGNSDYCVSDYIQTMVEGKETPVKITSIHHDRIEVSNSKYVKLSLLDLDTILNNVCSLLSQTKDMFSTTPSLCMHYASMIIELDNAIVRLKIDSSLIREMNLGNESNLKLPFFKRNYQDWADKIQKSSKHWGYDDWGKTNDVCYFYPGFDYVQFIENHYSFWKALQDRIETLREMLMELHEHLCHSNNTYKDSISFSEHNDIDKQDANYLYVSYSWSQSNDMDEICKSLECNKISYKRDIKDCGYRTNIKNFEREIGKGNRVIVLINKEYLQSINCMYEMALISQKGNMESRVFQIFCEDFKLELSQYADFTMFWEQEYEKRKNVLSELSAGVALQAIDELSYCNLICSQLPNIWKFLYENNYWNKTDLLKNNCELLVKEIKASLQ